MPVVPTADLAARVRDGHVSEIVLAHPDAPERLLPALLEWAAIAVYRAQGKL